MVSAPAPRLPSALGSAPSAPASAPAPQGRPAESPYLLRALAELESAPLPGGGRLVLKRSPGAERAVAVLGLPELLRGEGGASRGLGALALGLAALGPRGLPTGALEEGLRAAGAELGLAEIAPGVLGLLLEAPGTELPRLLGLLDAALGDPAFLAPGFPPELAEAGLRELRLAERRRSLDPLERLRPRLGLPPSGLGDEAGLRSLGLEGARAFWRSASLRREILVLGDLSAAGLAGLLARPLPERLGGLPASAPRSGGPAGFAGSGRAGGSEPPLLLFPAPRARDREAAALLVGLGLLEELCLGELGAGHPAGPTRFRAGFDASRGLGSLSASGGAAAPALAALEAALRGLRAGFAASPGSPSAQPFAELLPAARNRALAAAYAGLDRRGIALALAAETARGGDGSAFYRLEGLIFGVQPGEIGAALESWLAPERLVWRGSF